MTQVLIVDDNEQNLYMLQVLLQGQGHEVRSARNGIEALDMARRQAPDLIITDILMPGMDGFSLCREWMADDRLQHVPLVFYTATYTDPQDEALALNLGAARFIVKPTEPDAFVELLRQVLENHAAQWLAPLGEVGQVDEVYYEQYNQALIRKLEGKMVQLEEANRALELDIAARERVEEALRESEARYRLHFENISDVVYSIDPEFKVLTVSPSVEKLLGYTPEELIGRPFQELNLLAPAYLEQAFSDAMRVLGGERVSSAVYQFIARDGTKKWGEVSGAPLVRDGQVVAVVSVARDITERKWAAEALQESEEKYRSIVETTTEWIWEIDLSGRHTFSNPGVTAILGYRLEELIGLKIVPEVNTITEYIRPCDMIGFVVYYRLTDSKSF